MPSLYVSFVELNQESNLLIIALVNVVLEAKVSVTKVATAAVREG